MKGTTNCSSLLTTPLATSSPTPQQEKKNNCLKRDLLEFIWSFNTLLGLDIMILEYLAFRDWQRELVQNYIYMEKMKQKECLLKTKQKKTLKFECTNPTPMLIKFPCEYNSTEKRIRKPKLKKAG
jgi:hypothetical protein